MLDHIVVDVEIQKTIEETPGGWDATDKLGVACACVWEYRTQRMRVYGPEDVLALQNRLLDAERISGYNTFGFDMPVIWGHSKQEWKRFMEETACVRAVLSPKSDDMLRRIWVALGFDPDGGWQKGMGKLEDIALATLGVGKIGNGADAPKWYQVGQLHKVINYCCDDVALERDLCDFIERYGYVIHNGKRLALEPWKPS